MYNKGDIVKIKNNLHGWDDRCGIILEVNESPDPWNDQYIVYWSDNTKSAHYTEDLEMK
jgi:hypothetical protein